MCAGTPSKDNGIGDAVGQRALATQKSDMFGEETHIWGQVSVHFRPSML